MSRRSRRILNSAVVPVTILYKFACKANHTSALDPVRNLAYDFVSSDQCLCITANHGHDYERPTRHLAQIGMEGLLSLLFFCELASDNQAWLEGCSTTILWHLSMALRWVPQSILSAEAILFLAVCFRKLHIASEANLLSSRVPRHRAAGNVFYV